MRHFELVTSNDALELYDIYIYIYIYSVYRIYIYIYIYIDMYYIYIYIYIYIHTHTHLTVSVSGFMFCQIILRDKRVVTIAGPWHSTAALSRTVACHAGTLIQAVVGVPS